ncbi:hypothetical protein [Streptomyces sp. HNA39]|uniref:hypothetical protein n=1 Tax=Streptomyces sp. HNA39 TaxID=2850561 RepID=UPI00200F725E|nr:hypothetical protein [Streptomyces sp. HNA39]UQA35250.1 hypothetical protein KRR37_17025 [Streptomyces sp. HNA39]
MTGRGSGRAGRGSGRAGSDGVRPRQDLGRPSRQGPGRQPQPGLAGILAYGRPDARPVVKNL